MEDEKFHAHRQIFSIPGMLNSQFKEGKATEIPLPGKKANQVLDFLKLLYLKETKIERDYLSEANNAVIKGFLIECHICQKRSVEERQLHISSFVNEGLKFIFSSVT